MNIFVTILLYIGIIVSIRLLIALVQYLYDYYSNHKYIKILKQNASSINKFDLQSKINKYNEFQNDYNLQKENLELKFKIRTGVGVTVNDIVYLESKERVKKKYSKKFKFYRSKYY